MYPDLDKIVEVTMSDLSSPPRKFTTLYHEYLDLHTAIDFLTCGSFRHA
jgi:hypothetical protein